MTWAIEVDRLGKFGRRLAAIARHRAGSAARWPCDAVVAAWDVSFASRPGRRSASSASRARASRRCCAASPATSAPIAGDGAAARASVTDVTTSSPSTSRPAAGYAIDHLSIVYQDPAEGLDLRRHRRRQRRRAARRRRVAALRPHPRAGRRRCSVAPRCRSSGWTTSCHVLRRHAPARPARQGARQRAAVLLLDEPTTGLDASVAAGVLDLVRDLLERARPGRGRRLPRLLASSSCSPAACVVMHHGTRRRARPHRPAARGPAAPVQPAARRRGAREYDE